MNDKQRIAELEAENDKLAETALFGSKEMQKRISQLEAGILRYGNHEAGCKENDKNEPCQCGLDALLQQSTGKAQIDRDCGYPFTACNSAKKHAKDCPSYSQPVEAKCKHAHKIYWLDDNGHRVAMRSDLDSCPTCPAPTQAKSVEERS